MVLNVFAQLLRQLSWALVSIDQGEHHWSPSVPRPDQGSQKLQPIPQCGFSLGDGALRAALAQEGSCFVANPSPEVQDRLGILLVAPAGAKRVHSAEAMSRPSQSLTDEAKLISDVMKAPVLNRSHLSRLASQAHVENFSVHTCVAKQSVELTLRSSIPGFDSAREFDLIEILTVRQVLDAFLRLSLHMYPWELWAD